MYLVNEEKRVNVGENYTLWSQNPTRQLVGLYIVSATPGLKKQSGGKTGSSGGRGEALIHNWARNMRVQGRLKIVLQFSV